MPRPFKPVPELTVDHAAVAAFVVKLDDQDRFKSALEPWRWTLPAIRARQTGELNRGQACLFQELVFEELRVPNRDMHWAILAATETLPGLVLDTLTDQVLQWLLFNTAALWRAVFGKLIRTPLALRQAVETRKAQFLIQAGTNGIAWTAWFDRVGDRLLPFIRPLT